MLSLTVVLFLFCRAHLSTIQTFWDSIRCFPSCF